MNAAENAVRCMGATTGLSPLVLAGSKPISDRRRAPMGMKEGRWERGGERVGGCSRINNDYDIQNYLRYCDPFICDEYSKEDWQKGIGSIWHYGLFRHIKTHRRFLGVSTSSERVEKERRLIIC